MTTPILQPGEIPAGGGEPPFCLVPDASSVFADRARRFAGLAAKHPQGDWLRFLGTLSDRQQAALAAVADVPLPTAAQREQARTHAMPPLAPASWPRDAAWRRVLPTLVDGLDTVLPAPAREVVARLRQLPVEALEALAARVLDLHVDDEFDRAASLFVGAALQVYWTAMASRLDPDRLVGLDSKGLCPCCGSPPVASVVRIAAATGNSAVANLRYLHCALCNTEWNLTRVVCAHCGDGGSVAYRSLRGPDGVAFPAVRAETCEACRSYLKIIYQEHDPLADPVADDLATLALDLLVDEAGYQRAGPNLLLLGGR